MTDCLQCNICLKLCESLARASENDGNNLQILYKLKCCVPDVEWTLNDTICYSCLNQLDIVYTFRELCIQAQKLRQQMLLQPLVKEDGEKKQDVDFGIEFSDDLPQLDDTDNEDNSDKSLHEQIYNSENDKAAKYSQEENYKCNENNAVETSHEEKYTCDHCKQAFDDKDVLLRHIIKEHDNRKAVRRKQDYVCQGCGKKYTSDKWLKKHQEGCGSSKNMTDDSEEKTTSQNQPVMITVEEQQTKQKPEGEKDTLASKTCTICGNIFSNKYLLKRHLKNVHVNEKKYNCELCSRKFASVVYLNAHKRYHSRDRSHICAFCGKGYITASDLYHHEKIHANQRSYHCEKCSKAFNTSSDLHKHRICVHMDRSQWKYECSYCQRRFPLKTNLDTHTKIHTGEKNFVCHLCDHRCINKSVLMRHIETHSNERSFKCTICSQGYKYKKSLDFHMSKVHGVGELPVRVKKYFCHICPKSYFVNNKLQKHLRTHSGERPFKCPVCMKGFADKSYVKQHLKISHGKVDT